MFTFRRVIFCGVSLTGLLAGLAIMARAQGYFGRYTSPAAKTSVTIDGKQVSVAYYAPSMHGRKVMGGLVPYGEVWCTGANDQTSIMTEADLDINGMKLPKGNYTLYTLPTEKEWKLIINKQTGQFHTEYHPDRDFGRVPMNIRTVPAPVE